MITDLQKRIIDSLIEYKYDNHYEGVIKEMDYFGRRGGCHDWHAYIPEELEAMWGELPIECRIVAYLMAEQQASAEEYD